MKNVRGIFSRISRIGTRNGYCDIPDPSNPKNFVIVSFVVCREIQRSTKKF